MSLYAQAREQPPHRAPKGENILLFANRLLFRHVTSSGGLGAALKPSREFMAALAAEFSVYVLEGDELATPAEFLRRAMIGLEKIAPLAADTRALWERRTTEPDALVPFAAHMAVSPDQSLNFDP
jgi:hypothetical protein